jgi:hypothetical protein
VASSVLALLVPVPRHLERPRPEPQPCAVCSLLVGDVVPRVFSTRDRPAVGDLNFDSMPSMTEATPRIDCGKAAVGMPRSVSKATIVASVDMRRLFTRCQAQLLSRVL